MESWLDIFEKQGWVEWKNFLSPEEAMGIRREIEMVQSTKGFRRAAIGKLDQQQVDTGQRGDFISWIDSTHPLPFTRLYLD
ncbi:MAG: hypothetical protein ACKO7B_07745, partial [Flavobacteriales bacterium]